jgi:biopolymer transport protein ExbD
MKAHSQAKALQRTETVNLGFQIAPMIDVIFVIMLFFMVMAGQTKVERELKLLLPSDIRPDASVVMPDEVIVGIEESGHVTLNEEEMGLAAFTANMTRLNQESQSRHAKVLVTLQAQEQAKYERIIDVIDSLAKAGVSNLTFAIGGEE